MPASTLVAPAASPPSALKGAPHLPHTGCLPTTLTRSSTRFFAPHFPQVRIATLAPPSAPRPQTLLQTSVTQLLADECDTTARRDERRAQRRDERRARGCRAALKRSPS